VTKKNDQCCTIGSLILLLAHLLCLPCMESARRKVGCGEDWWCDVVRLIEPDGARDVIFPVMTKVFSKLSDTSTATCATAHVDEDVLI